MTHDTPIITTQGVEPTVEMLAYECKFTVECREGLGGDFQRNVGGQQREKRVTFDGYANPALIDAIISAIGEVSSS